MEQMEATMVEPSLLREISLFSRLSDHVLDELVAVMKGRELAPDQVLFELGDPGDEMFIVQSGEVSIYVPDVENAGQERPIRIFGPGEAFGEMALIDHRARSLSARSEGPSQVLVLTGNDFMRILRDYPEMSLAVMGGLNDRIRYTTEFLSEVQDWVKRIAEGNYDRQFTPSAGQQDRSIASLAAEFAQMAAQVQKREEELRRQVMQLRIEIDQAKKERQVSEIVESDYFQSLKQKARRLRSQE